MMKIRRAPKSPVSGQTPNPRHGAHRRSHPGRTRFGGRTEATQVSVVLTLALCHADGPTNAELICDPAGPALLGSEAASEAGIRCHPLRNPQRWRYTPAIPRMRGILKEARALRRRTLNTSRAHCDGAPLGAPVFAPALFVDAQNGLPAQSNFFAQFVHCSTRGGPIAGCDLGGVADSLACGRRRCSASRICSERRD